MVHLIRSALERLRESLFFVPSLMIIGSIIVAFVAVRFDESTVITTDSPFLVDATVTSSRTILATVAGATVTVAGIVFAMTAVTVQLGASMYSPRIIRGFQRDRFQQVAIGAAAGTFTFCLLAMSSIQAPSEDAAEASTQSRLTVTLGVVFGVVTIVAIVAFIDHVVRRMRVDEVIRSTADDTTAVIRAAMRDDSGPTGLEERTGSDAKGRYLLAPATGWIRTIDEEGLVRGLPPTSRLRLDVSVGDFVTEGLPVGRCWTDADDVGNVWTAIEIGRTRSLEQDPRFGIQLLVDIALRALSPGINDPTTAVTVVRHIERPMMEVLSSIQQRQVDRADGDRILLTPNEPGHEEYVVMAFRPITEAASDAPPVLLALIDVMARLRIGLVERGLDERVRHLSAEARILEEIGNDLRDADRTELLQRLEASHLL